MAASDSPYQKVPDDEESEGLIDGYRCREKSNLVILIHRGPMFTAFSTATIGLV